MRVLICHVIVFLFTFEAGAQAIFYRTPNTIYHAANLPFNKMETALAKHAVKGLEEFKGQADFYHLLLKILPVKMEKGEKYWKDKFKKNKTLLSQTRFTYKNKAIEVVYPGGKQVIKILSVADGVFQLGKKKIYFKNFQSAEGFLRKLEKVTTRKISQIPFLENAFAQADPASIAVGTVVTIGAVVLLYQCGKTKEDQKECNNKFHDTLSADNFKAYGKWLLDLPFGSCDKKFDKEWWPPYDALDKACQNEKESILQNPDTFKNSEIKKLVETVHSKWVWDQINLDEKIKVSDSAPICKWRKNEYFCLSEERRERYCRWLAEIETCLEAVASVKGLSFEIDKKFDAKPDEAPSKDSDKTLGQ